jgi:outer membrane immunogenic protein
MKYLFAAVLATTALVSVAQAADLIVETEVVEAVAPAYDWSGPYVGIFGGYGWGSFEFDNFDTFGGEPEGWLLGVEAGANFQMDTFVLGIEGDIAWSDASDGITDFISFGGDVDVNWLGTLTARAGVAADRALFYVEGGIAAAEVQLVGDSVVGLYDETSTAFGWVVGGGVEFALTDNITTKLEYNYVSMAGSSDFFGDDYTVTAHTVKAGLNLAF